MAVNRNQLSSFCTEPSSTYWLEMGIISFWFSTRLHIDIRCLFTLIHCPILPLCTCLMVSSFYLSEGYFQGRLHTGSWVPPPGSLKAASKIPAMGLSRGSRNASFILWHSPGWNQLTSFSETFQMFPCLLGGCFIRLFLDYTTESATLIMPPIIGDLDSQWIQFQCDTTRAVQINQTLKSFTPFTSPFYLIEWFNT